MKLTKSSLSNESLDFKPYQMPEQWSGGREGEGYEVVCEVVAVAIISSSARVSV